MTEVFASETPTGVESAIHGEAPSSCIAVSLGTQLRKAREAQARSISDVVQVIRFSAHQIEALERDDYGSLPGATSARGLVRNYAKFLKLDPEPLLAMLEPTVPVPEAEVRPPTNMGEAEQVSMGARIPPRILAGAGVIAVLLLAGYWYLDDRPETIVVKRQSVPPEPSRQSQKAVVETPVPVQAANVLPSAAPTDSGTTQSPPPVPVLRIEFDDRSWVEIRDATQKVVLVGEYAAGTRQNVEGKAPFQIWIGKASGVRVFLGERSIDLKPHTREEVARFTLD